MLDCVVAVFVLFTLLQFRSVEAFVFASPFILLVLFALCARRYVHSQLGRSFFEPLLSEVEERVTARVRCAAFLQYVAVFMFVGAVFVQYFEVHTVQMVGGGPQEDSGGPEPTHFSPNPDAVCSDRWMPRLARNGARVMGVGFVLDSVERCEIPY